jgi:hypothetical protein
MVRMYSVESQQEVRKTLQEFHEGRLVVGNDARIPVTSLRQAIAIGRARARRKYGERPASAGWWGNHQPTDTDRSLKDATGCRPSPPLRD